MEDVRVSIICNTYNHFPYITDCLEGFLKQKTNFSFEVLVHDDASTDGTDTIVREYAKRYRNIIKPIYQSVNQYSRGINISMQYQFPRVRGKYIALCEGDDYWTDPLKLQRQYDIMEKYPDIDICAHSVERISASTGKRIDFIEPYKQDKIILTEQVIMKEGGFVGTSSLFFRSRLNYDIPKFRKILPLDYTIQIHGALRGGMLYLCNPMSVYRWMTPGSWTSRQNNLKK